MALAANFVFALVMLQKLSAVDYGIQSALVAFAGIIFGIADLGLLDVGTRELTRQVAAAEQTENRQRDTYFNLLMLQIVLSGVTCLIAIGVAYLNRSFAGPVFVTFLLGIFTLVFSYAPIIPTEALLTARGQIRRVASLQTFYALATVALSVLILLTGGDLRLIYIALSILSLITIAFYLREAASLFTSNAPFHIDVQQWIYSLKQGLPIGLSATFLASCLRLSTYLALTQVGAEQAGYLGVSNLLIQAVSSIVWVPYVISIFPVMVRLYGHAPDQLKWLSNRSLIWLLTALIPICVGTMLLAPDIVSLLSAAQVPAAPVLRVLIWALPLAVLASLSYRLLLVRGQQHFYVIATGVGALINGVMCLVLIPRAQAVGAAAAVIIGMAAIVIILLVRLRDWFFVHWQNLDVLRMAVALGGMVAVVHVSGSFNLFIRIAAAGGVYGLLAFGLRLLTVADWQRFRQINTLTGSADPQ